MAIARYHQIGDLDWAASPIMRFLYATDRREEIPAYATAESVWTPEEVAQCVAAYGKSIRSRTSGFWKFHMSRIRCGGAAGNALPVARRGKIGEGAELAGPENFTSPVEQAVGTR